MTHCYCPDCTSQHGYRNGIDVSNPLGTSYQRKKHHKHTREATRKYKLLTTLDSAATDYLAEQITATVRHGSVRIDGRGNRDFLFSPSTGSSLGALYEDGVLTGEADTLLAVRTTVTGKGHLMLDQSSRYSGRTCDACGGPFLRSWTAK